MKFEKFNSIEQFRNIVKEVKEKGSFVGLDDNNSPIFDSTKLLPTINFYGSVKLHGTNASIVLDSEGNYYCQSRNRIITPDSDNAGFAEWAHQPNVKEFITEVVTKGLFKSGDMEKIVIYGEWAGKGIQSNVALSEVDRFFSPFECKVFIKDLPTPVKVYGEFLNKLTNKGLRIFSIDEFGEYHLSIDFNQPELSQQQLVELVNDVETSCPAGKYFGVDGIGEGLVFRDLSGDLRFKVKGEKHSVTKVKTLAPVDIEKYEKSQQFVEYAVTENRFLQGIEYLREHNIDIDVKSTGQFLKWVCSDVAKEEGDLIAKSLDKKAVFKSVQNKARSWFIDYINNLVFNK